MEESLVVATDAHLVPMEAEKGNPPQSNTIADATITDFLADTMTDTIINIVTDTIADADAIIDTISNTSSPMPFGR